MSTPESLLQILSRQTTADNLDCIECCGAGEQLVFDSQNGHDYELCEACQGSGYNLLGMLVHGLIQPPEEGFGPQAFKASLEKLNQQGIQPMDEAEAKGSASTSTTYHSSGQPRQTPLKRIS